MKIIEIRRFEYTDDTTIGRVYVDDKPFCYSLEDTVRPENIKVKGYTAIPKGDYKAIITHSNRFGRDTIQLYNDKNLLVSGNNCSWSGVRVHGGNTAKDTEGCPLVAYKRLDSKTIQQRADNDLLKIVESYIKNGHEVVFRIINENQKE